MGKVTYLLMFGSIEDNILVTADGHENLTPAPKDPSEIEAIIQNTY